MKYKHGLIALLTLGIVLFAPTTVHASPEFETTFVNTYQVGVNGTATVKQTITLVNNLANIYATEYEIDIGSTRIKNPVVTAESGVIIPMTVSTLDNKTRLHLNFTDKVVGRGKKRTFTVQYENPDAAQKIGKVLEITIPKLTKGELIDTYQIIIQVPVSFGPPTLVTPAQYTTDSDPAFTTLTFTNMKEQGVSAIFGTEQIYDLNLKYNLQNPTITPTLIQVALPPDTAYQKLYYESLEPQPQNLSTDADGNWIATFELEPKEQRTVAVAAKAVVYIKPTVPIPAPSDTSIYLSEQPFWQINDPEVKRLAGELKTPDAIYTYLVEQFSYNYARLDNQSTQRLGAAAALKEPNNVLCQEFADAFVALVRAAGIPARVLTGYALTENSQLRPLSLIQDVLHAWPEYYDAKTNQWIPVDPTWGNTTGGIDYLHHLDFNHIVFAIQGVQSAKPNPVGYYKLEGQNGKDIEVRVSAVPPNQEVNVDSYIELSTSAKIGLHQTATLHLKNLSNRALYHPQIILTASGVSLASTPNPDVPLLLPFQDVTMPLSFTKVSPDKQNGQTPQLTISILGTQKTHTLPAAVAKPQPVRAIALATVVVTVGSIVALFLWSLLVPRRKK